MNFVVSYTSTNWVFYIFIVYYEQTLGKRDFLLHFQKFEYFFNLGKTFDDALDKLAEINKKSRKSH